jgi:branched-chain amino acid transport system ATP-binding protein
MRLLSTAGLTAFYGDFQALFGIDLAVEAGEAVAIIGANGAGKSTLLRSICGLLPSSPGAIRYRDHAIGALSPPDILALGIALVPEGRRLFPSLTVEENLLMGTGSRRNGPWNLERVYKLFPILRERRRMLATSLSGGQQQMVAIGRALMTNPELLLCDELSLGLAPVVIRDVYAALPGVRGEGTTLVVVEQDVNRALAIADRVYCLQEGRVTLEGRPGDLTRDEVRLAYFGV